ncbi:glycerophosphodiester phosphodiesterase family protein [Gracilibacillus sp. S3-1-1]|uniref:Glycerophosphodiester phosphodiesterase family protein n=1 Tax=Gracilibacillus pellucidus TaxID=3095368 RepID=A0ACC6M644_9BACI|nr:glycerophosphodiester phosphodiesterase family protein [Gracilibacillus sp. S3-1-1]MDX8046453.1 glycerophosphodiester phosphodiesterase family protein [Gracilibacillus sp. S3-1-1]
MKKTWRWGLCVLLVICLVIGASVILEREKQVSFVSLLPSDKVLNIAHRGASGHAPEHTLIAYDLAEKMNADYLEIDLHMTADHQLVAIHDEDVGRTTNGVGFVSDLTLAELKELDAGTWFNQAYPELANPDFIGVTIPTLAEIFELFGLDSDYYIELKDPDDEMIDAFLTVLNKYDLLEADKVIIQSFSQKALTNIHAQYDEIPLIQLLSKSKTKSANYKKIRQYAAGVGLPFQTLDKAFIEKIQGNGLHVHAFTVNETEDMERLIDWGIDGIFTNYPDRLADVLW